MKHVLAVLLVGVAAATTPAAGVSAAPATTAASAAEARYQALIDELRCLVCQNQSIAESNAPLAQDLREQVRLQIATGKTDAEIAQFLTDRYGDFVLYRPPFRLRTALLWIGPFVLLAAAALLALLLVRRSRPLPRPDPDAVQRLLDQERPR